MKALLVVNKKTLARERLEPPTLELLAQHSNVNYKWNYKYDIEYFDIMI